MSGDWIKMRMDLPEDPAVYKLASITKMDRLSVVGRLYAFWAWADKHAVDGRVDGASSLVVDDVTRTPGFADALVAVKWLEVGEDFIALPKHERHNGESAKERGLKNARQAKWRQGKDKSPSTAVDAQPSTQASTREEKRREEEKTTPPIGGAPPADDAKPPAKAKADHGTRLPADWTLPDTWAAEARRILAELNRPDIAITREAEKFRDHWTAQPGQLGRKSDWLGTWRNWVRKAVEFQRGPPSAKPSAVHLGQQDYSAGWGK